MTPYQKHRQRWKDCTRCPLCERRNCVVLARGRIPCQVLLVGEAPGESEDVIGQPFVGPAGHLLDRIVAEAVPEGITTCFTNVVACIPRGVDGGKAGEPPEDALRACAPRLLEIIAVCRPRLIVRVGKLADQWVPATDGMEQVSIVHPAFILRADVSQQGLLVQRCVVTIEDAVADLDLG